MPDIAVKRVYEAPAPADGYRVLVDRVWPRGLTKEGVKADLWLKTVAPSTELRKWFGHEPARWKAFEKRYFAELDDDPVDVNTLLEVAEKRRLTLVYSARDTEHNQAVALREYLLEHARPKASR